MALLAFIVVVLICIGAHELGHFVFAKRLGIRVDEFSLGFGPRVLSRQWGETRYSLRAIPVGGFVRMAGMLGLRGEADAGERNFYRASIPARLVVMVAGIAFNLILALLCFTVVAAAGHSSHVVTGTPAYSAGLRDGDSITAINGRAIRHDTAAHVSDDVGHALDAARGAPVSVDYTRDNGVRNTMIAPALVVFDNLPDNGTCDVHRLQEGANYVTAIDGHAVGRGDPQTLLSGTHRVSAYSLGSVDASPCPAVQMNDVPVALSADVTAGWKIGVQLDFAGASPPQAVIQAARAIAFFPIATAQDVAAVATTRGSGGVFGPQGFQGPVGIAQTAGQQLGVGLIAAITFIGYISMNVGYLNLLPIPFLDGGKILIVVIEAVRRKRLRPEQEAGIYAAGLAIILLFLMYVTVADLRRLH